MNNAPSTRRILKNRLIEEDRRRGPIGQYKLPKIIPSDEKEIVDELRRI